MEKKTINKIKKDINICLNKKCTECSYWRNGIRCSKRPLLELALETIETQETAFNKAIDTICKKEDFEQLLHQENQNLIDENQRLLDEIESIKLKFGQNFIEIKHAYWEDLGNGNYRCSLCHKAPIADINNKWCLTNFCTNPKCNAKMENPNTI